MTFGVQRTNLIAEIMTANLVKLRPAFKAFNPIQLTMRFQSQISCE